MVVQDPAQDAKAAYDRMTIAEAHEGFARNFNRAWDATLPEEEQFAAASSLSEWSEHTDWMWGSVDLTPLKARYEKLLDFRKRQEERPRLEAAYESGATMTVDDSMWWPAALGKADPGFTLPAGDEMLMSGEERSGYRETRERIYDAPQGTRYRFGLEGDRRFVEQLLPDGTVGFKTNHSALTVNPFADARPGRSEIYAPRGGAGEAKGALGTGVDAVIGGLPFIGGKVDKIESGYRNWLHQVGIRGSFGVGRNVLDENGRMSEGFTSDDPEAGLFDAFTGGAEDFYIEPELQDLLWSNDDVRVYDNMALLYGDVTDEDGRAFVKREGLVDDDGNELPFAELDLYPIRPDQTVTVTTPAGHERKLTYDEIMGEASNAIAGGKLGVNNIAGHFYYGDDEVVDTPFGRMLVPKMTGNVLLDKELMRDPRFLRSILYADEKYGSSWMTRLSQEMVGLGEFVGSVKLGRAALKRAGKLTKPVRGKLKNRLAGAERGGLGALFGRTGQTWGRAMNPSAAGPAVGSVFTFNPSMIGSMVWYETVKGVATGEGSADEWLRHGVAGGISLWAFGAMASIAGRGFGLAGRGVAAAEAKLGKGRINQFLKRYESASMEAKAFKAVDDRLRALDPSLRRVEDAWGNVAEQEFTKQFLAKLDRQAAKHVTHSFAVGALMGSYSDAQYLAMRAGEEDINWWDPAFMDYWAQAWEQGGWSASALAFASITGAEYGWNRRSKAKGLLTKQDKEALKALSEYTMRELDLLAQDPDRMGHVFEVLGDPKLTTSKAVNEWLHARLGASELAMDLDAPDLQAATIEHLGELALERSGPRIIEEMLSVATTERLNVWEEQAAGVRMGGEMDIARMRGMRSVLEQVKAERERREGGGPAPERPKKTRKKREPPPDIPEEEWADHFADVERSFLAGKSRERHRLRASRLAIVEALDPESGERQYVVVDQRQRAQTDGDLELYIDRSYPFTPEGLRKAMGDTLARTGKRKAERALVKALRKARGEGGPEARQKPGPKQRIVVSEEAEELLEELEVAEGRREEQRAEGVRTVLERVRQQEEASAAEERKPKPKKKSEKLPDEREPESRPRVVDPVPEKPETIRAQVEAMLAGRKPAVLITPGEEMPKVPEGYQAVDVPRGTLILEKGDDVTLRQAQSDRTLGHALGYGRGSIPAINRVVTARNSGGVVVADIQSPPNWRVLKQARDLAGPGGTVEKRTVEDALAEREGRAMPLTLAPPPPGSRPPTVEELSAARRTVADALEGRRGFGGLTGEERASRYLRPRDVGSIEALEGRVSQARDNPPPPLVPPSAAKPSQPVAPSSATELDAALLEAEGQAAGTPEARRRRQQATAQALQQAREATAVGAAREQARVERDVEGPRSSLWTGELGRSTRAAQFRIGSEFWHGEAEDRHVAVFATVQSRALRDKLRAERGATENPESQAELDRLIQVETERLESIVAGMLVATGLTPPPTSTTEGGKRVPRPGFQPTISRLTGMSLAEVEGVRQRMIGEGRRFDPLIEEYLDGYRDSQGRRLISSQQLHRTTKAGHQPTFDMLRVVALAPPADLRLRRGHQFQGGRGKGSLHRGMEKWVELEEVVRDVDGAPVIDPETEAAQRYPSPRKQLEEILQARGVAPSAAAKVASEALDGRLGRVGEIQPGRKTMTDVGGQLVAKVAWSMHHQHRMDARATVPTLKGEPTLEEVALTIVENVSGRTAELKERGQRVRALELMGPEVTSRAAARAEEVKHADPESLLELYFLAGQKTRDLLQDLGQLRIPDPSGPGGDFVLPRGNEGRATFISGIDSMRATNLLRRLTQGDPVLLELFKNSTEPDGTPTYEKPEEAYARAQQLALDVQAAQQHMLVTMAKERYGPESAEQVRAVLDALEWTSRGDPVPDHLVEAVGRQTELFVNGALDSRGVGIDAFMSEMLAREMYSWINEQGQAIDYPKSIAEVVPMFAGVHPAMFGFQEYQGRWSPVRVEALSLGRLLGHQVDGDGLADWVAQGRGPFLGADGSPTLLGRWASNVLGKHWFPFARQLRSRSLPREVRAANWVSSRAINITSQSMQDAFFEQAQVWRDRASQILLTTAEANTLGKILDGGGFRRLQSKADWVRLFGEHRPELYDLLHDMADTFNRLAQWGVDVGALDPVAARKLHDSYFPHMWREMTKPAKRDSKARAKLGLIATGSARERSRDGHDVAEQSHDIEYDSRISFPLAVWQEATWNRVWQALGETALGGGMLTGEAHGAMPETGRMWWKKATEPFGGRLADRMDLYTKEEQSSPDFESLRSRRRRATVEQTRLDDFLAAAEERAALEERDHGRKMPAKRRQVIDALRDGYFTRATSMEIDSLLDSADPSLDVGGVSAAVQRATLVWRRLKTVQNPKHWWLNFTSSVLTNHITDKVSVFDFMRSVTTGKGLYAEAARDLMRWHDWVREGRPELDSLHPATLGIMRADRIGKMLGGGTFVRTAFGRFGARDVFDSMFTPRTEDVLDPDGKRTDSARDQLFGAESQKSMLTRAIEAVVGRRGRSQAEHDERMAHMTGVPDPRVHAEALAELNEMYYLHEMLFKYAAALHGGKYRGLSEEQAAAWGAEGSGDYRDRPPVVYRHTTNFSAGISDGTRAGLTLLGKKPELPLRQRAIRMGLGSPFWMYRWSMWPTLGRSMIDRPVRTAAVYALMSAIVQGVDELTGGDRRELQEAQSGRNDYLSSKLTPEAFAELKRKYGSNPMPSFVGVPLPPWLRVSVGDFVDAWTNIKAGPGFMQAPGPSGEVLDFSALLAPGLGEVSKSVRNVSNLLKARPATDIPEVQDMGIGFLPGALLAGSLNAWELAFGREGQSRRETSLKVFSRMAREFSSAAGPLPMLSGHGQRGLLMLEGRTLTDLARGTPGPEIPLGARLGSYAISLAVPTRQVLAQSVERREIGAGEEALRRLGIRRIKQPSGEPDVREQAIINRAVNSMLRRQMVNSYREFIDHGNFLPMQVIVNRNLEIGPDLQGFPGQRRLADQAQTEVGRFIRRLVKEDELRGLAADRYETVFSQRAGALQDLAVNAATRRNMHPATFERMVDGILRGENSQAGILEFLFDATGGYEYEPPEWAAEHAGEWVRVWDDARMWEGNFSGTNLRRFRSIQRWIEANRSARDTHKEILAPQIFDAPAGLGLERLEKRTDVAPPDLFRNLLRSPR